MPKIITSAAAAVVLAAAGVAVGAALAGVGSATSADTYRAAMSTAAEVPKPSAPKSAKGLFTATVTGSGAVRTIRWKLTFAGLSGKAVAAHIHRGRAGVSGGVLLSLCGPCTSGRSGTAKISKDAADVLERGLAYVNVHTAKNGAGEIRGQAKLLSGGSGTTAAATDTTTTTPVYTGGGTYPGY